MRQRAFYAASRGAAWCVSAIVSVKKSMQRHLNSIWAAQLSYTLLSLRRRRQFRFRGRQWCLFHSRTSRDESADICRVPLHLNQYRVVYELVMFLDRAISTEAFMRVHAYPIAPTVCQLCVGRQAECAARVNGIDIGEQPHHRVGRSSRSNGEQERIG